MLSSQVHLPCEDHTQALKDQRCQGPVCLPPSQAQYAQKVPFHQAQEEEETLDPGDHLQSEDPSLNRDPDQEWALNLAHVPWAQEAQGHYQVLDKGLALDLVRVIFVMVK